MDMIYEDLYNIAYVCPAGEYECSNIIYERAINTNKMEREAKREVKGYHYQLLILKKLKRAYKGLEDCLDYLTEEYIYKMYDDVKSMSEKEWNEAYIEASELMTLTIKNSIKRVEKAMVRYI